MTGPSGLYAVVGLALLGACHPAVGAGTVPAPPPGTFMPSEEPGRAFALRDMFPRLPLQNLTFAVMPPRTPQRWFLGEREGRVLAVPNREDAREAETVLDLRRHTLGWQDTGLLNMVFHPEFGLPDSTNRGYMYVWYNYTEKPHPGPAHAFIGTHSKNRLSRFTIPDGHTRADPGSELVLIEQERTNIDHQGGGMFFHPDNGFLYLGVGDGGHPYLESRGVWWTTGADDPQRIDRDLLSGVLRIDVDRRGGRVSHPIRRQAKHGRAQGYFIPFENPWQDSNGGLLEEFFAIGLRNPHRLSFDRITGRIFAGDVGEGHWEEVDVIDRGGNFQWNYREGQERRGPKPDPLIGSEQGPLYVFPHDEHFTDVIGGVVYRGRALPQLAGKYLFGDNGNGQISYLDATASAPAVATPLLRLPEEMVAYGGLSSFAVDAEGEVYLCVLGQNEKATGSLRKVVRLPAPPAAPPTLSATGLFQHLDDLTPAPQLFPYQVNSPFWSDHKQKTRWLYVPAGEPIQFRPEGEWTFPPGTVAVKHFDLMLDERDPRQRRRLETRVLVMDAHGGAYGRTYRWRPGQQDADLVTTPITERLTAIAREPFGPLERAAIGGGGEGSLADHGDGKLTLHSPSGGLLYAHTPAPGDFDVAASFASVAGGAGGLMLREGLGAGADYLLVAWEASGEGRRALRIERRLGETANVSRVEVVGPWLRLRRSDGVVNAYASANGQIWQEVDGGSSKGMAGAHVGIATVGERGSAAVEVASSLRCLARDHRYPSGGECMACHTRTAHYLLGVNTRQWNREVSVPAGGHANQLVLASQRHLLDTTITENEPTGWKKLAAIDDPSASLEERARSYLDSNCAQCHRPGVLVQLGFDARYDTPLARQGLVLGPVRQPVVPRPHELVVMPRDVDRSRLYQVVRGHQMPPLGSLLPNPQATDLLEKWINSLD